MALQHRNFGRIGALIAVSLALGAGIYAGWTQFLCARRPDAGPAPRVVAREPSDREIVDRFAKMWYDSPETWKRNHWLGIPTQQNPDDVWIIQEIICEQRPDVILETGTLRGGSAALWAMILAQVNPQGRVISIDIEDNVTEARELPIVRERVEYLVSSSTEPDLIARLTEQVQGKRVLVILDSDHSRDHVLKELQVYAPLVQVGGYLIVQDSNVNGHPVLPEFGPGPMEALEEFLESTDEFEIDKDRERLMHTMHPQGYLRRVKPPAPAEPTKGN